MVCGGNSRSCLDVETEAGKSCIHWDSLIEDHNTQPSLTMGDLKPRQRYTKISFILILGGIAPTGRLRCNQTT